MPQTVTKKMTAFHGDPGIKQQYLERVRDHEKQDEVVQHLFYWAGGMGCAVGCTIHGREHSRYEKELGIPESIAYLQDTIFENLSGRRAKTFPRRFLEAIPVGADLSPVIHQFLIWLLTDEKHGVEQYALSIYREDIRKIANLHQRLINDETIDLQHLWDNDIPINISSGSRLAPERFQRSANCAALSTADIEDPLFGASAVEYAAEAAEQYAESESIPTTWIKPNFYSAAERKLLQLLRKAPVLSS